MFKVFLTAILWSSLATLAIPTTLILASWNATPGDSTYKLKVGLEQVMLGVALSDNMKSTLQIKYTERRFDEVEKVLHTSHASESLNNFNNQLIASRNSVQKLENLEEKSVQTQNLINTLEEFSQKIEQEKPIYQTKKTTSKILKPLPTLSPYPTSISVTNNNEIKINSPSRIPTSISTPIPVVSNPTDPSPSQDISSELDKTHQKIQEVISELKKSQRQEKNNDHNKEVKQSRNDNKDNERDTKNDKSKLNNRKQ